LLQALATFSSTDDLAEGVTNLYFTGERVDDRVAALLLNGANITLTYNDVANTLTIAAAGGGGGYTVVSQSTTPYNATQTTGGIVILCDCTAASITINLPPAVANTALFRVKKIDATANTVTIDPSGAQTIDGGATAVITTRYESIDLASDNANWNIL
jgi:hypothetical protein